MKNNYKNLALLNIICIIFFAVVCSSPMIAQTNSIQCLADESKAIQDSINTFKVHLDDLRNRFAKLNSDIYQLKTELRTSENPIKRIKLGNKLKESSRYADQIKQRNIQIDELNNKLKINYKEIIKDINRRINLGIKKFNSTANSALKTKIIKKVDTNEEEKQKYYKLLNKQLPTVIEDDSIVISNNDNLDRLNLKIDIIKDRLTFLEEDKKYLLKTKEELNSDLLIYVEMDDFINDISRNIDEEQEFYDPDRAEQINRKMEGIKNKLQSIKQQLNNISKSKTYYNRKLIKFNNYKKSLLFH